MDREKLIKNLIYVTTLYFISFPILGVLRILNFSFINYLGAYILLSFFTISTLNLEFINKYYLLEDRENIIKAIVPIEIFIIIFSLTIINFRFFQIGIIILVSLSLPILFILKAFSPIVYSLLVILDFNNIFLVFYSIIIYLLFFEKNEKIFWKFGKRDVMTLIAPLIYYLSKIFAMTILFLYLALKFYELLNERFLERKIEVSLGIFSIMTLFFMILASKDIIYWSPMVVFMIFFITIFCVLELISLSRRMRIIKNINRILKNTYAGILIGIIFFALVILFPPRSLEYRILVAGISIFGLYYYLSFLRQLYF